MYHYTYRITNTKERMYYYGVHSCVCQPKEDIGVKYWSTSKNKEFKADIKNNPQNYKYKVLKIFETRIEAVEHEIFLHKKFNVGVNNKFYNDSMQTSTSFDTSGRASVKDKDGNTFLVNVDDPRYLSGELVGVSKGNKMSEEFCQKISNANKGRDVSDEHRENLSKALTGKKKSPEHIANSIQARIESGCMGGDRHHNFKGYYITPLGRFDSPAALIGTISLSQMKNYCNNSNKIIPKKSYDKSVYFKSLYTYDEIKDRTYGDLGFSRDLNELKDVVESTEPKDN